MPTARRYTGQRLDAATGLYFYNARYYDPGLARFTQPDTIVPNPGDPQSLNRYSYAGNNPLRYTDPSGHCIPDLNCPGDDGQSNSGGASDDRHDTRNLDIWIVMEMNHLARLPEGMRIRSYLHNRNVADDVIALYMFYQLVRDGAPLDVKDKIKEELGRTIQLNGQWFEYSTAGNILYGFYGKAWGLDEQLLYAGAGTAQIMDHLHHDPGETPQLGPLSSPFYGDTVDDHYAVQLGIEIYQKAYASDQVVTLDEFRALKTDYQHLNDMAILPRPPEPMPNKPWPYHPGYFNSDTNPPWPSRMFPSF